ncbi:GNAT family N-acetyltransferase [Pseudoneobacillus sp. C159]
MTYSLFTLSERPELLSQVEQLHAKGWAKFMLFDEVAAKYFGELPTLFPQFQFVLQDETGEAIACGNSVPFHWDGNVDHLPAGWDGVLQRSVEEHHKGIEPNTVSAIAIVVNPSFRGGRISELMVRKMKELVRQNGFEQMVAPVRPSLKTKYPLIPMERYAYWNNQEGFPFDPWLRVHARSNAIILKVANESMKISGSISDWESWSGMKFPESGLYTLPEALVPIEINIEEDYGVYIEPNVWMKHLL